MGGMGSAHPPCLFMYPERNLEYFLESKLQQIFMLFSNIGTNELPKSKINF